MGVFFSDNAAMLTIHIQISSIFLVEIKKCANLQQIRSERDIRARDARACIVSGRATRCASSAIIYGAGGARAGPIYKIYLSPHFASD